MEACACKRIPDLGHRFSDRSISSRIFKFSFDRFNLDYSALFAFRGIHESHTVCSISDDEAIEKNVAFSYVFTYETHRLINGRASANAKV